MTFDEALAEFGLAGGTQVSNFIGGNSVVYCVELPSGEQIALKIYKGQKDRIERMFDRESKSMTFLNQNGVTFVPQFRRGLESKKAISYAWISGQQPLDQSIDLLTKILNCAFSLDAIYESNMNFEFAIDAVISGQDILSQIKSRIDLIEDLSKGSNCFVDKVRSRYARLKSTLLPEANFQDLTLSFSDVGAHNTIVDVHGNIYFIDLEFFGVDSKIKICADLLAHPRTRFKSVEIIKILSGFDFFNARFVDQLLLVLPAISLKWSLIVARREFLEPELTSQTATSDDFLDYFDFLIENTSIDGVKTFQEFKKMRQ